MSSTKLRNSCPGEPQLARRLGPVLDATSVDGVLNLMCERQHVGHAHGAAGGVSTSFFEWPLRTRWGAGVSSWWRRTLP